MTIIRSSALPIQTEQDIVLARQMVRALTQELGFGLVDQTKMVTATSELARNALIYGLGGTMNCDLLTEGARNGLRVSFVDRGPGIDDVELAMKDGWTSGRGMGLGLSGAKRLVNDFTIETAKGAGTTVTIIRWK